MIDEKKCLELYQSGLSKDKIRKIFGVHERKIVEILNRNGIEVRHQSSYQKGASHSSWKGGKTYLKGYVMIYAPEHPHKTRHNRVAEHRLVMEKHLGRYLTPDEVVDHINGIKDDNNISNLRVFANNGEHLRQTLKGKIPQWSKEGKKRILIAVRKQRNHQSKSGDGE
jgi:hypothetical protein